MSKPPVREQKKSVFMPTYYCWCCWSYSTELFFVEKESKPVTRNPSRKTDVPKFVHVCHFCGVRGHILPNYHKLKFKFVGL